MQEVEERQKLHNVHTHHVAIQSELKYLIRGKMPGLPWPGFPVETGPKSNGPGFSCGKTRCNSSVPVPTLTRNRSSGLEPLLTLT